MSSVNDHNLYEKFQTINDILPYYKNKQGDKVAYRFVLNDEDDITLTYEELYQQAYALSFHIQQHAKPFDRVILSAAPGLDFIVGFYACLLARTIAVPIIPRANATMANRFSHIIEDAEPALILLDKSTAKLMHVDPKEGGLNSHTAKGSVKTKKAHSQLHNVLKDFAIQAIRIDELKYGDFTTNHFPACDGEDIAFLQYTSGSTGNPKGVIITHANLLDNVEIIRKVINHTEHSHTFSWLPPYHDMGLIAGIIEPLYAGVTSTLMSTLDFIARPTRWVKAISKYQCTHTGGPNFAYELCAMRTSDELAESLDLSKLEVIANGAEPINPLIMDLFYKKFAASGLRPGVILPCYGLAETTLIATAKQFQTEELVLAVDPEKLKNNEVELSTNNTRAPQRLVSSGIPHLNVKIVNPDTFVACEDFTVGEIWIEGGSVAKGYYNKPEETAATFHARIKDDVTETNYLRTGDLGFFYKGEVFVCGRIKNMIIIRGQNYYPQDFEFAVTQAEPAIRRGCVIAYGVKHEEQEALVIVAELRPNVSETKFAHIIENIKATVSTQFQLTAQQIILVPPRSVPKTSSGKLQRIKCQELIDSGQVIPLFIYRATAEALANNEQITPEERAENQAWLNQFKTADEQKQRELLKQLILKITGKTLSIADFSKIDINKGFFELGIDSIKAVAFKTALENKLNQSITIDNTLVFNFPNIKSVIDYLHNELSPKKPQNKLESNTDIESNEEIAIIGMSCNFPGAENIDDFWRLLMDGREGITEVPSQRWQNKDYYSPVKNDPGKTITNRGGFTKGIELFDASFFSLSPKEIEYLDPQQRMLLTETWTAFESANVDPLQLKGSKTGVFIGISSHDYEHLIIKNSNDAQINPYWGTGNAASTATGRISYYYGLQGPNMAIETACSSSLVALHEACKSLLRNECNMAVVGGVNAILTPELTIVFSQAGMLAPDGKCKTFDEKADGYVRGEGCGVVIIKKRSDAIRDKDTILALIKSSGINQDGASSGLTVPNGEAQRQLLMQVLAESKLQPNDIDYIECHGTGTSLGDPIEVQAIGQVYGKNRAKDNPLHLGSVKTNIGHLEAAAGMAGLIKTILALQHAELPQHLNFKTLNPLINLNYPAEILTNKKTWSKSNGLRRAAVSSFGFSGTNAHVILEEATKAPGKKPAALPTLHLFVLSAKSKRSLELLIASYHNYLAHSHHSIADICYTAAVGRAHFNHRIALLVRDTPDLLGQLQNAAAEMVSVPIHDDLVSGSEAGVLHEGYLAGRRIDWVGYYAPYTVHKVTLPHYCFDESHHWLELKPQRLQGTGNWVHELLGLQQPGHGATLRFINQLDTTVISYLADHIVHDHLLFPGAGFIESALAAGFVALGSVPLCVKDLVLVAPLALESKTDYEVSLEPEGARHYRGLIYSKGAGQTSWVQHVTFNLEPLTGALHAVIDLDAAKNDLEAVALSGVYARFAERGLQYGSTFQSLHQAYAGQRRALVALKNAVPTKGYHFHPTLLDGVFQAVAIALGDGVMTTYIPVTIRQMDWYQKAQGLLWVQVLISRLEVDGLTAQIVVSDVRGVVVAEIHDFMARAVSAQTLQQLLLPQERLACYQEGYDQYELPTVPSAMTEVLYIENDAISDWQNKHVVFHYKEEFAGLVSFAKKILENPPLSVTLVTQDAFSVENAEKLNPEQAQAVGFWRSFAQEANNLPCFVIDTSDHANLQPIIEVIAAQALPEPVIIVRDQTYVPRLIEYNLAQTNPLSPFVYYPDATYLITGGTGGLGLKLAKQLIDDGVEHLALVSRNLPSAAVQEWIKDQNDLGIVITHYIADVANKQSLQIVFDSIAVSGYPLRGVFHAAGVLNDELLQNATFESMSSVLAPKILGSLNLHELTRTVTLDCLVFFSSISALLGNMGQSAYAAGNAFMDALAHTRRQKGMPGLSINWGPFAEVGMAHGLEELYQAQGLIPLQIYPAFALLKELLSSSSAQFTVMQVDWSRINTSNPYLQHLTSNRLVIKGAWVELLESAPVSDRRQILIHKIKTAVAEELDINDSQIDSEKSFFDLGMDSIMALSLKNKLQMAIGQVVELNNNTLFNYRNVVDLTNYLLDVLHLHDAEPVEKNNLDNYRSNVNADMNRSRQKKSIHFKGGDHAVLLLYGINGSALEIFELSQKLNEQGYSVEIPYIDGYHYEPKHDVHVPFDYWILQALAVFRSMKERYKSVSIGGLCGGAVLTLRLAELLKEEVSSLLLLSTSLYFDGWNIGLSRSLIPLAYYSPLRYKYTYQIQEPYGIKNQERRSMIELLEDPAEATLYQLYQAQKLSAKVKKDLSTITAPTLIIHAQEDDMASLRNVETLESNLSSSIIEKHILQDSYHMVTIDNEQHYVQDVCVNFMNKLGLK